MKQPSNDEVHTPAKANFINVSTEFGGSLLGLRYLETGDASCRSSQEFWIESCAGRTLLVAPQEEGFVLRFEEHWQGWVCASGRTRSLRELMDCGQASRGDTGAAMMEFAIPAECTIVVLLGLREFWIRPTQAVPSLPRTPVRVDASMFRSLVGTGALVLALGFGIASLPDRPKTLKSDRFDPTAFLLQAHRVAMEDPTTAALHPAYSKIDKRPSKRQPALEPRVEAEVPTAALPDTADAARVYAQTAGVVGVMTRDAMNFDEFVAAANFAYSDEEVERLGDLRPSEVDEKTGAWGHGIKKIGPGSGDGKDWGTEKTEDYELAKASQTGKSYEAHSLSAPHVAMAPAPTPALASIIDSGIKYDVIRGQLGLRKRRLRLCFENELSDDEVWPSLVHVQFDISPSGEVTQAEVEDTENRGARSCVAETLLSIRFEKPSDGKVVRVEHFPIRL